MKNWYISLALIPLYLGTFAIWQQFPSRWIFVAGGVLTAIAMTALIVVGMRRSYFAGKLDLILHALVAADVLAEGGLYEFSRAAFGAKEQLAILGVVHGSYGYFACAAGFAVVIGSYRAYALYRRTAVAVPAFVATAIVRDDRPTHDENLDREAVSAGSGPA